MFTVNYAIHCKLLTDTKGDGKCCTDMQTGTCTVHVHRCLHMWGRLGSTVLHGSGHQVAAVTKLWINYSTAARAVATRMPNETTLGGVPMDYVRNKKHFQIISRDCLWQSKRQYCISPRNKHLPIWALHGSPEVAVCLCYILHY